MKVRLFVPIALLIWVALATASVLVVLTVFWKLFSIDIEKYGTRTWPMVYAPSWPIALALSAAIATIGLAVLLAIRHLITSRRAPAS